MFMGWLEHHLKPAFKKIMFPNKKMIYVLDNASYHHGYDPEVEVPETNSEKYNVDLLRNFKAHSLSQFPVIWRSV